METLATKQVTIEQLAQTLYNRKGCAFASIDAEYSMDDKGKMKKTGNPFLGKGIRKVSTTNVMVTFDYEASMERRGDEAKGGVTWHQALTRKDGSLTPLSVHKADILGQGDWMTLTPFKLAPDARLYLRCEFRSSESKYVDNDGKEIDKKEIEQFLPARNDSGAVNFHLVSLKNVKKMRIDKTEFVVIRPLFL